MSDSFHGRNTVLLQTHFILEKTVTCIPGISVYYGRTMKIRFSKRFSLPARVPAVQTAGNWWLGYYFFFES